MGGVDNIDTAQAIVNYIRPHLGLEGMTPAQRAGLDYVDVEDNPWLIYIKKALKEKRCSIYLVL